MYLFLNVSSAILFFGYLIFSEGIDNFIYKIVIKSDKELDKIIEWGWEKALKNEKEGDDGRD